QFQHIYAIESTIHLQYIGNYAIINDGEHSVQRREHTVSLTSDSFDSSSVSRKQVTEAYLKAIRLIDERVTPYLGKATTRVLVQGAARRKLDTYPCLSFFVKM